MIRLVYLICFAFAVSGTARADQIDDIKTALTAMYAQLRPSYKAGALASTSIADQLITQRLNELGAVSLGGVRATTQYFGQDKDALNECFTTLSAYEKALKPVIDAEPPEGTARDAYRKSHYTADDIIRYTIAVDVVQRNFVDCYARIKGLRGMLLEAAGLLHEPIDFCPSVASNLSYDQLLIRAPIPRHVATKLDAGAFTKWPSVTVTISHDVNCAGSSQDTGCDDTNVQGSASQQGQDRQNQETDQWRKAREASPAIAGLVASIIAHAYFGATLATAGWVGGVVGVVVCLAIAAYENWEMRERVNSLNDYVDEQEKGLRDIWNQNFMARSAFESDRDGKCATFRDQLNGSVHDLLGALAPDATLAGIDGFLLRSEALQTWYNDLFLFMTKDGAVLDQVAAQKVADLRQSFFAPLYQARAEQEAAALASDLDTRQSAVSLFEGCSATSPRDKARAKRDLVRKIQSYDVVCESGMETLAKVADLTVGQDLVSCTYAGFAEGAALIVDGSSGSGADAHVVDASGATLATFHGVSSSHPASTDNPRGGLRCLAKSGSEFGPGGEALPPGRYPLNQPSNLLGLAADAIKALRDEAHLTTKLVRRKALVCMRKLTGKTTYSLPLDATACGIEVTP